MTTQIERLVDTACRLNQNELKNQTDVLLKLADAAVAWQRAGCDRTLNANYIALEEKLDEAISDWIDLGNATGESDE